MKVIIKTLSGKQLPIEVENDWSIRQLKEAIEKEHEMKADALKLIAYGKVLDNDDKKLSDHSIKENDFIVAMVQKAKVQKPKKEDAKKEEPISQNPPPVSVQPPVESNPQPTQPPAATTNAAATSVAQAQPQPAAAQQLTPEQEASITELMAISGKPRDLVIQALQAAQNIPDVAFEFLMSGYIPPVQAGHDSGGADQYAPEDDVLEDDPSSGGGGGGLGQYNLDPQTLQAIQALVNNPSFPMIRQRMIQDPQFSAQFMQQLQQTQPSIFNAIQQNPGILMSLILGHDPMSGMGGGGGGMPGGGMGGIGMGGQGQPPPGTIQVSQEEMDAITRLQQLGFPKNRAAEAYFACDKNEEMAANFLFESGVEDEESAVQQALAQSQQPAQAQPEANAAQNEANPQPEANVEAKDEKMEGGNDEKPGDDKKEGDGEGDAGGSGAGGDGSSLA